MKGRGNGREDPWLLIKKRDEPSRGPRAEYSVVDEMPDSVQSLADRPGGAPEREPSRARRRRGAPARRARGRRLPATLQPQLATLVDEPPRGPGRLDLRDQVRRLPRAGARRRRRDALVTRNGNDWTARCRRW